MTKMDLLERFIFKITSGRFIWTVVMAGVFAYLACAGTMPIDRVMEVLLVGLYAYFTQQRNKHVPDEDEDEDKAKDKPKTV